MNEKIETSNIENEIKEEIAELNKKLYAIKRKGWHKTLGKGSGGIGKTLETLIGKKEDSNVFKPKIDKNKMMNEDNDLHPGDMVNHDKYGFGVVVTIDGSIATISFKRDGLKKLMKNHKSIHKM